MLRDYQVNININTLYNIRLKNPSGLGETIKPRITAIGGDISIYGSETEPSGLTQANITDKMALIDNIFQIKAFESLPNYIAIIESSGTITELVLTSIEIESSSAIPVS